MRMHWARSLNAMAEVILKNIKKVYPHSEPKKKKKGEQEKKTNLQITSPWCSRTTPCIPT
mgnify:CR=1 FL=1